jgi:hypothetical protein
MNEVGKLVGDTMHMLSVSDNDLIHLSMSLNEMPQGVDGSIVKDGGLQLADALEPFMKNKSGFIQIMLNIKNQTIGETEISLLSEILSAWNNFPPADEPKDLFICLMPDADEFQVLRTSPEDAKHLSDKFLALKWRSIK